MSIAEVTRDLRPGDVVQTNRQLKVTAVGDYRVQFEDVKTGQKFSAAHDQDHGTLDVELVARPRPKVGDVIDGKTLRTTTWHRGTVVVGFEHVFVLRSDGRWFSPGKHESEGDIDVPASIFNGPVYTVLYLP